MNTSELLALSAEKIRHMTEGQLHAVVRESKKLLTDGTKRIEKLSKNQEEFTSNIILAQDSLMKMRDEKDNN